MTLELTTVADDEAVAFDGVEVVHVIGLEPGSHHEVAGLSFRTLDRPPGERLATVAAVNDVHFGEEVAGVLGGRSTAPTFSVEPGETPYPEVMNRAAVAEISAVDPDVVVVKGDLTADGTLDQVQAFHDCYGSAFGEQLIWIQGNHESYHEVEIGSPSVQEVALPGVTLAVLDTSLPRLPTGGVSDDQLEWLDELASRADRPVLVFGHHHAWDPGSRTRSPTYFGINPDDSERLVEVVARRRSIVGYLAGHTHRNRVRRFQATGEVPWVEVACVKDFPGAWAEYRVFEGGILQVFRRISAPEALEWSERTRGMFEGLYPEYAFGELGDRCFAFPTR
ncbi:MAG TPA: metallophosphoesterase [Acidimicrobiales bacterium]|nr:metallophosphoesterase [Acidimicrobiales bacterium]